MIVSGHSLKSYWTVLKRLMSSIQNFSLSGKINKWTHWKRRRNECCRIKRLWMMYPSLNIEIQTVWICKFNQVSNRFRRFVSLHLRSFSAMPTKMVSIKYWTDNIIFLFIEQTFNIHLNLHFNGVFTINKE